MIVKMILRILRFSGKYRERIEAAFIFSVLNAVLSKLPILYAMFIISRLYDGAIKQQDIAGVVIAMVVTLLLQMIFQHAADRLQSGAGYLLFADKRMELAEHLRAMPMGYFTEGNIGKISSVLSTDMLFIEENIMAKLANILSYAFSAAILIIFMYGMDWRLGTIAVITSLAAILTGQKMDQVSSREAEGRQAQLEDLTEAVLSFVEGIAVIKSYNLLGEKSKELSESFRVSKDKSIAYEERIMPWMCGLGWLYAIGAAGIFAAGLWAYGLGSISVTYTIGMLLFVMEVFHPLKALYVESSNMTIMDSCLDRIEEVLQVSTLPDTGEKDLSASDSEYEVEYQDVRFAYGENEVLHGVSFGLKRNSMTALVGRSGSGKSTVASLLARFWDIDSGRICIKGVDIRELSLSVLMKQISMVFQKVYLFNDTVYNNILLGRSDATESEVIEAAKKARCYDFIMALPDGFQTVVGEGGAALSGGEKQRISIARCILKDAPIIILDEATASVDVDNESCIQEAISELVKGKTLLVIAHRLNTIQSADQILVLSDGQISQKGTHKELITQPGLYQDLVNIRRKSSGWNLTQIS